MLRISFFQFTIGLTGVHVSNFDRVEKVIEDTLYAVARDGIEPSRVAAAVHQVEIGLSHKSTSFGMGVFRAVLAPWIHGGDPVSPLQVIIIIIIGNFL